MSTKETDRPRAPRPGIGQRIAAGVSRGIENFGDEVYGNRVDRAGRAEQDRRDLDRIAVEDAQAREFIDELIEEHADLISSEDREAREFVDAIQKAFIRNYGRELSVREEDYLEEYVEDYRRDSDGGEW